ncbi:hypothetical protein CgunFtcFv8_017040 [Champsocephalus gunnari]|uniref:Echinoderm microtubule-associated protein-like 1 n=1 Tax=Champsocephalus gunnari TaxID=52237 RepID=A0AAN8CS78_CHAGU|nr:hypothetical protein CgunFtcFv8_017040 [Champsocephalus gunnari]
MSSEVTDRLSSLELRVQQQEDELTVMKAALADVLRRLDASESKKQSAGKGGAALKEAYSMSCISNGGTPGRKRESTSVTRKETLASAAKSGTDRKKEGSRSQMMEIQEREEPPRQKDLSPSPSSPHPPPAETSTDH